MAHGPIEGDAHGAVKFKAGVQLAVNALHNREFFHAGGQFLVGHGIETGVFDRNRRLSGKRREQVLVINPKGQAIALVDNFNHTDNAVFDFHGDNKNGPGNETRLTIRLSVPGLSRLDIIDNHRLTGIYRLAHKAGTGRQTLSNQVRSHRAHRHLENEFIGLLIHQKKTARFGIQNIYGALKNIFEQRLKLEGRGQLAGNHIQNRELLCAPFGFLNET